jgi:hypothetical protein
VTAEIATATPLELAGPPPAQAESLDSAYWARHCEGYRVHSANGRLGLVHEVREQHDDVTIAVRAGLLGRRLLLYSAEDIAFIVPRAQTVYLRSSAELIATEPLGWR